MKKINFTILLACILATNLSAQEKKHNLSVGTGIGTTSEIIDALSDIITTGLSAGTYSSNKSYTGAYHLGYKYGVSERISAGATLLYEHGTANALVNKEQIGRFKNNYFTLAAEGEFRYIDKPAFKLYGILGAGATLFNQEYKPDEGEADKDSKLHFNFQVSPIGIKLGNNIGIFAEAGFGYKGIVSAGVFTNF